MYYRFLFRKYKITGLEKVSTFRCDPLLLCIKVLQNLVAHNSNHLL